VDLGGSDDNLDPAAPSDPSSTTGGSSDSDDPPATPSAADPLRAERRRSNQLEKELRKARAQLARFSEINPDEYARLQDAERKREEFERQVADRERQLNEANLRRVRSVEKERDEARSQVLNLRKERLMERLFSEAEGRVGGDERGTFFDTFVTLCGGHFQLGEVDGKGQPLTADGVALSDGDYMEELRRHPVYSFLFQQRSGLYSAAVPESGHEHGGTVNLQTLSTTELYLEAVKGTTPRAAAPRR
jgi:multidrug efflux pump subunit AcrA (membrane-fusion protein)